MKTFNVKAVFFLGACLFAWNGAAHAEAANPPKDAAALQAYLKTHATRYIAPIFSQLLSVTMPAGYTTVFETTQGDHYIREAVLDGENVDSWSRMITVTGFRNLSSKPEVSPKSYASSKAAGFQRACRASYSAQGLGDGKIDGADVFVAVASCGISPTKDGNRSETALIIVLKGSSDYYTIQWAERGAPSDTPLAIDVEHWREKYQQLFPVKLCPIVAGEAAPYPSCINRR